MGGGGSRASGICRFLQRTEDLKTVSNVDDVNVEEEYDRWSGRL